MSKRGLALLIAVLLLVGGLSILRVPTAAAASVPPGFSLVPTATGQGEYNLTDFVFLPSGGMLTTGKNGRITHVAPNGAVSVVTTIGVETYNDLGLLGLAIGPDFADTGWVYVVYNYKVGDLVYGRLSQLTVDSPAAPRSVTREVVVVDGIEHNAPAHTLGQIVVDTDGTIWFGMGDASPYEYHNEFAFRAQDLDQPQGKIFHINPNGSGVPDNPFYNAGAPSSWRSRVWAYGFRNPFRFSLHADGTPYIGDVGWNVIEELSIGVKGGNFGWPCLEGNHRPGGYRDMPRCHAQYAAGGTVAPLWSYDHSIGRSITGGVFATGKAYPEPYRNAWFFGDFTARKIWTMETTVGHALARAPEPTAIGREAAFGSEIGGPVSFRSSPSGEIHYAEIFSGNVVALRYSSGNRPPTSAPRANVTYGDVVVEFFGEDSHDPDGQPLTYDWDFGDGSAHSSERNPVHTYPSVDTYTATLRVTDSAGASSSTSVVVAIDDHEPTLAVTTPPSGHRFRVDDPMAFTATAADVEDSDLGSDDVTWRADLVHCTGDDECHVHPGRTSTGASFSMPFPDHGGNIHVRVNARVEDSVGHVATSSYEALPQLQTLAVTSSVGAPMTVNGEPVGPGGAVRVVANGRALVSAAGAFGHWVFDEWADGDAPRERLYRMPSIDAALEARYRPVSLNVGVAPGPGDGGVLLSVSPVGEAGDLFTGIDSAGCAEGAPIGDNGDGLLGVGETWSVPCRVSVGSYPGEFVADVAATGPFGATARGQASVALASGYRMVASDGGIFSFAGAPFYGSTGGMALNAPIVGMANGLNGYWMVASDGGVFAFAGAPFLGSMGGRPLFRPIVGMAATPSGNGYWLVASDGGIFTYGDAGFFGSTGGQALNQPIVGMAATPSGNGYWLVASDGGIFSFGDAAFLGSTGGQRLFRPIVGMAATPTGNGYWLVASDGGIFTFGDAWFYGSTGGQLLNQPIVGMTPSPGGMGYWLVASDGGIFTFGTAAFAGSMGGTPLNRPVVGMTATLTAP